MLTRAKAFAGPFPGGPEWTDDARSRLGLAGGDDELVRAVAQGWMRLGSTGDSTLVDTLFVLTDDRLGFGQTHFETTDPNWIELSSVHAIDLIEGVPYPLDAVEVQFVGGLAIFVGWPEEFTTAVLSALREGGARSLMAPLFAPASGHLLDQWPGTASDAPTARHPVPEVDPGLPEPPATMFAVADRVELVPIEQPPAEVFAAEEPDAELVEEPVAEPVDEPVDDLVDEPVDEPDADLVDQPVDELFPTEAYPAGEPTAELRLAELAFFGHLEHDDEAPEEPAEDVEDLELPQVPESAEEVTGPWDDPAIAWPDAFRDSAFLGGHPIHQRRRKSCTVVLERRGLVAATPRSGGWQLHIPWHAVTRLDVQGADEIKFTHNQRVHSDGSVLVADLADGTTLLFEIRAKRPAAVRAAVAPIKDVIDGA